MFSDHNGVKLEVNDRNIAGNFPNVCTLNDMFPNNSKDKEKIK